MRLRFIFALFIVSNLVFFSEVLMGAGSGASLSYYSTLLEVFGIHDPKIIEEWKVVPGALVTMFVLLLGGLIYRSYALHSSVVPDGKFSVSFLIESLLGVVDNLGKEVIGHGYEKYLSLLMTLFLFIFVSNLSGLIPGVTPATDSISTNLAMGLTVFIVYNISGLRANGFDYVKHFFGPIGLLAPLMLIIELIGHCVRPLSLSLRLYGNIFGDHLVLSVFGGLVPLVVPCFFLMFGLLVASVQSFVFTLLTSIYISLATSHDH